MANTVNSSSSPRDFEFMQRAFALAARGQGFVEPNPMVGCVIVRDQSVVGEGWHRKFGGPHAEIDAIAEAGAAARGATMYVTLEPCSHHGKTPPCTDAIVAAGVSRVFIAEQDPYTEVNGRGILQLRRAGLETIQLAGESSALNGPYRKLVCTGQPWVIAKWAMSLDGKMSTACGDSRWISNESSRRITHAIRGRVDAILIGARTAELDNPLLTARPPGARLATRVVLDHHAAVRIESQLVQTATSIPTMVVVGREATRDRRNELEKHGCEVLILEAPSRRAQVARLLEELGQRRMTNLLVEGGGTLLGAMFDASAIDEVHVFMAPKLIGGARAVVPVIGQGSENMQQIRRLDAPNVQQLDGDVYVSGRVARTT